MNGSSTQAEINNRLLLALAQQMTLIENLQRRVSELETHAAMYGPRPHMATVTAEREDYAQAYISLIETLSALGRPPSEPPTP